MFANVGFLPQIEQIGGNKKGQRKSTMQKWQGGEKLTARELNEVKDFFNLPDAATPT